MSIKGIYQSLTLADGREILIETGRLAKQADGAAIVKMGKTMLLATVVSKKEANEGVDFMPLSVDYQEKYAATGRFPGGFLKRESRSSDYEILISRLIDRALRPLFPSDFHAEVQVAVTLISGDKNEAPDALACLAACAAISVSDIPFNGPVSEVRVARIDGKFVANPSVSEMEKADIDLIIAATLENIMMVEGESKEVSEDDMVAALKFGHAEIKKQCIALNELAEKAGKTIKREYCHEKHNEELKTKLWNECYDKLYLIAKTGNANKHERSDAFKAVKDEFVATLPEEVVAENAFLLDLYFHDCEKEAVRNCVLKERIRLDGRKLTEIRPIWSEVDYLPSAHGSAIFTRGETQSLTTVTLGTKTDAQMIDGVVFEGSNKFMLHYNFPSFSTGEVKPNRGVGRREIGHGNLALRALKEVIPTDDIVNPYTIRVVSDILESNGSSSMATVCAGTLALMDAGVKIKSPVSGIAMGLITNKEGEFAVLSDILGDEDHLGDMDFKVTGTKNGITACQMDIKVDGLSYEVLTQALNQAKEGRLHILGEMMKTISSPRADYKDYAPRVEKIEIPTDCIGAIIGPGGKVIQELQKTTGTTISIEEINNKGIVDIMAVDKASIEKAKNFIKGIVSIPEIGDVYEATVKKLMPYGAFVEFLPGKEGLLHISEVAPQRVENIEDVLQEKQKIQVKLVGIDQKSGKFKLSRKILMENTVEENN